MIDEWIDNALSTYTAAEPLTGLEQRVINRLHKARDSERRRRIGIVSWALAISVLASLIIAVTSLRTTPQMSQLTPSTIALAPPLAAPSRKAPSRTRRRSAVPKRFPQPNPEPITSQERDLLALATRQPAVALHALAGLQKKSDEPIEIQEIQIEPLQSDGNQ